MELKEQLRQEIEKWLGKLEKIKLTAKTEKGKEFKKNIEAYIKDSQHFLEKGDLVRAFEAIIWAWAFLEISEDLKILELNSYENKTRVK